jgi:ADP-ribosylglycohydrolase
MAAFFGLTLIMITDLSPLKQLLPNQFTTAITGALWGTFFGDASGFLIEKQGPTLCKQFALEQWLPWWEKGVLPTRTRYSYTAGQTSDDSVFSAILAKHVLAAEDRSQPTPWSPDAFMEELLQYDAEHGIVGMGKGTKTVFERVKLGYPSSIAGIPAPQASNGCIMRGHMAGFCALTPTQAINYGHSQALATHRDPRCLDSAVILALFAHNLRYTSVSGAWSRTLAYLKPTLSTPTLEALQAFPPLTATVEEALKAILAITPPEGQGDWDGISPYVFATLFWSLWCFLKSPTDLTQIAFSVFSGGGDTDTTAAIAFGLYGYLHPTFLPDRIKDQLKTKDLE